VNLRSLNVAASAEAERFRAEPSRPGGPRGPALLSIDKPVGLTSHDLVMRARRSLRVPGAGHLGTLDPAATGLLLVAIGPATRAASVWQGGEKLYRGVLVLGVVTHSQDTTGRVLETRPVEVGEEQVRAAALRLVGEIEQLPPMVSALRVGGRRLYELARQGREVDRPSRRVHVAAFEIERVDLPRVTFTVRCGPGTYVRTLAHDLGQALGCGAALDELRRLRSEPFGLERACSGDDLLRLAPEEIWSRHAYSLPEALAHLPAVDLDPAQAVEIGLGAAPRLASAAAPVGAGRLSVVLRDPEGDVIALGELVEEGDALRARPHLVFPWAVREGRR
jgi:tRNA pseudouridine55 synthase